MNVLILHNTPKGDATIEDHDVLAQRDAVAAALEATGHHVSAFGCTLNLERLVQSLREARPDVVFNLVESLGGTDRLMPLPILLLEALRIPYTGASSTAILATSSKLATKRQLRAAGLPTPTWYDADEESSAATEAWPANWILKPVWEHASVGMEDDAVVTAADQSALRDELRLREKRCGRQLFAERFVEGREFNVSLLAGEVLPVAEIDFSSFPPGKPRIVGQRAKWEKDSYEYRATPRSFDFSRKDQALLSQLAELSRACWQLFGLTGFARVDFRVNANGRPWILEINVNPCLSPDAGFAAAVAEAGLSYEEAIQRLVSETRNSWREPANSA